MRLLQAVTLLAATVATGLMAGVFGLYAHTIMPGLRRTDDRTFVGAFQAIDRAIINPLFVPTFLGTPVLIGTAGALHLSEGERSMAAWIGTAFVAYLAVVAITLTVHVPRNDAIKAVGDPDLIPDLADVRQRFDEAGWAHWNVVRAVVTTAAAGCLAWALVLHGRIDPP